MVKYVYNTIGDVKRNMKLMIDEFYGGTYSDEKTILRKDTPVTTAITGVYQAVYGAQVFKQFNEVANTVGALPKFPMPRTGVRVLSASTSTTAIGGVAEGGAIPATIKPTWAVFSRPIKEVAHAFDVTSRQELTSHLEDDAPINLDYMREAQGEFHRDQINRHFLTDVTTLASNNFESMDRIVSSYAEVTNCGDVDANDSDIFGLDRDAAATWADANVGHNSNTNRALTLDLIRTQIRNIRTSGGVPNLIITGPTTAQKIDQLIDAQARYTTFPATKAHLTANGVETANGIEGGFEVATLFGLPIIEDAEVLVDGAARIYILDTTPDKGMPKLGFALAQPTSYYEYGMKNKDPSGINKLATEAFYYTAGELHCSVFAHQAKVRDISA